MSKKTPRRKNGIRWLDGPEKHDYPAAEAYLCLTIEPQLAAQLVAALEHAAISEFAAKDIFRASALSLLGVSNSHVEKDRKRIIRDEKLAPLLLVRDRDRGRTVIADGYHRLCAVYTFNEDAIIPCKIV